MDDLRKIGLKIRELRFKELSSPPGGAMSLTPVLPPPSRKVHLWVIFCALPAELKCEETDTEQESRALERKPNALYTDNNIIVSIQLFVIIYSVKHSADNFFL